MKPEDSSASGVNQKLSPPPGSQAQGLSLLLWLLVLVCICFFDVHLRVPRKFTALACFGLYHILRPTCCMSLDDNHPFEIPTYTFP